MGREEREEATVAEQSYLSQDQSPSWEAEGEGKSKVQFFSPGPEPPSEGREGVEEQLDF